jgi:hypothetical protein
MTRFVLLFLFLALALPSLARADLAKIPPEQQKVLADVSRFREVYSCTNLPPSLVALCADEHGRIAEPGQEWNPTDVIVKGLPRSRLVWAAIGSDYYVVHFEHGGIEHTFELLIVRMKPKVVSHYYAVNLLKDYRAFVRQMEGGRLVSSNYN